MLKFRLFLIKLLLGGRGLIANIELDRGSKIEIEDRFLWVGGSDLWGNRKGLTLMNVTDANGYGISKFKFGDHTKYRWAKSWNDLRTELIEKYGEESVKNRWIPEEQRFKTNQEVMEMTDEEYREWYDENLLPF